jgi:hypothetical protein
LLDGQQDTSTVASVAGRGRMEVLLLFILSGAVSWAVSALVLLAFLHALGRATANGMGLPLGSKPGIDVPANGLGPWPSAAEASELAPASEVLETARERRWS